MSKKQKEKIIWVDDGRTVADMSGISRKSSNPDTNVQNGKPLKVPSSLKEQLRTFFDAMGFMFLPTLAIVGLLIAAFLIVYLIL